MSSGSNDVDVSCNVFQWGKSDGQGEVGNRSVLGGKLEN